MTAELYDLGMRLAAAAGGRPAARLGGAPLVRPAAPVAVRAVRRKGLVIAAAAVPGQAEQQASGPAVLTMLHGMGVQITAAPWRTLITQDDVTLPALLGLARAAGADSRQAATAAHIGWWADRADFPGSTGVVPLLRACRERWVTGTAPSYEASARTWRAWLRVPGGGCRRGSAAARRPRRGPLRGLRGAPGRGRGNDAHSRSFPWVSVAGAGDHDPERHVPPLRSRRPAGGHPGSGCLVQAFSVAPQ